MRTRLGSKFTLLFLTFAVAMLVFPAMAFAQTTSPTIQSDQADYAPGSTVNLTGSGWQPGESVHVVVNDTYGATWQHTADVSADANGDITDSFSLPNAFVSNYDVTATGAQSGTATTTFTDSVQTSTTLTRTGANPSTAGLAVGFTATVTCNGTCTFDTSTTGDTMQLVDGANQNCNGGTTLATVPASSFSGTGNSRTATFNPTFTSAGTKSLRACFTGGGSGTSAGSSVSDPPITHTVNPAAASKLGFTTQPTATPFNAPITPAPQVAVQDPFGNTVTSSNASVDVSLGSGSPAGTLNGATSQNASSGVATFNGLSIDALNTGYTLKATSSGLTAATSNAFDTTKRATTTTVNCSPGFVGVSPQQTKCTATVADNSGGTKSTPTGNVSWTRSGSTTGFSPSPSCTLQSVSGNTGTAKCSVNYSQTSTGTPTITASYAGDANYLGGNGTDSITVQNKTVTTLTVDAKTATAGDATVSLSATLKAGTTGLTGKPVGFELDGKSVGSVNTVSGGVATLPNVNISNLQAGTYPINATFDGDSSNNGSTGSNTLTVNSAQQAQTITFAQPSDKTYGDADFDPGATASSGLAVSYTSSPSSVCTIVSGKVHIAGVGNCTVTASQAGNASFAAATPVSKTFAVGKANLTVVTDNQTKKFGEANPTLTGSVNGIKNSDNITANYSTTATQNSPAGTYPITATLSDPDSKLGNYNVTNNGGTLTVNKADQTITFNQPTSPQTFGATFHVNPTSDSGLNVSLADSNNGVCTVQSVATGGYDVTMTSGTGNCVLTASQTGNGNYNAATSVQHTVAAQKADATINVNGYTGTYDGNAHGATGTATGVNGENLGSLLHLGDSFTNVPGGTANWTFDGNTNYNAKSGSVAININKADATIHVDGYTGVYDGNAHGASGTATGVGGVDLSSHLDLGQKFTDVPGGTAHWTFTGSGNYNDAAGDATITINKADATIHVDGYTGVYDGNAHGASGAATGVGGANLNSQLALGSSFTNVPGGTANWTFTGGTNYKDANGTANINISKATPQISITWANSTYNGNANAATATASGVETPPANLTPVGLTYYAGSNTSGTSLGATAPKDAGTYTVEASYGASTNYVAASKTATITIAPRPITVKADDQTKQIGAADPALTYSVTNGSLVNTNDLSGSLTRDPGESIGTYAIRQGTLAANSNYTLTFNNGTLKIVYGTTFSGVLQPINLGTQRSVFKLGSTVPVKFKLMNGTQPISNAVANLSVQQQDKQAEGAVNEVVDTETPTAGNTFRYDATGQQYILNLSTKNVYTNPNGSTIGTTANPWGVGTYVLTIKLDDGTTRTVSIDLGK